jgi:hypothetical protein
MPSALAVLECFSSSSVKWRATSMQVLLGAWLDSSIDARLTVARQREVGKVGKVDADCCLLPVAARQQPKPVALSHSFTNNPGFLLTLMSHRAAPSRSPDDGCAA